jgi:hypothetical protein
MLNGLVNIKTKRLFSLETTKFEQYHNTLKLLKAKSILKGKQAKSIESLTFGEVVELKRNLSTPTIENVLRAFSLVFELSDQDVLKTDVVDFYHAFNFIKEEITIIADREQKKLSSVPDEKLKSAGIEELNIFGELNTLILIGEKFGKSPQEVENWSYSLVFSLMYHDKISNDISKRYSKILNQK